MTHTYAVLEVTPQTYAEIWELLESAGYAHAFHEEDDRVVIDMHGLALAVVPAGQVEAPR